MSVFRSPATAKAIRGFTEARYARSGFARRWIDTAFGPTHLFEVGDADAPPVVLLHGTGSNALAWLGEIGPLAGDFRVIAPDLPGEPGLSADRRLKLAAGEPQAWLVDLLDRLGLARAAFVGTSLGGWLALGHATSAPRRVTALALLSSSGLAPARRSFLLKAIPLSFLGEAGLGRINRLVFRDAEIPEEVAEFARLTAQGFRPVIEPVPIYDDAALSRLAAVPVLMIAGGRDALLDSRASATRLARLLPAAEIDLRERAGHAILDAGPALRAFLQRNAARV